MPLFNFTLPKIVSGLFRIFEKEKPLSKAVENIEPLLLTEDTGLILFESVYTFFQTYDMSNQVNGNENFNNDVEFIVIYVKSCLSIPEKKYLFPSRINTYLYIMQRLKEYIGMINKLSAQYEEVERLFLNELRDTFQSSSGTEPNLLVQDPDIIKRLNLERYFESVTSLKDTATLWLFLALCKLTLQSSLILSEQRSFRWIEVFNRVKQWELSLNDFVSQYVRFQVAFEICPLDEHAFVYLISRLHPPNRKHMLPYEQLNLMLNQLRLDRKRFFQQYQSIFRDYIQEKPADTPNIVHFLTCLDDDDELYGKYLRVYSSHASIEKLWDAFIHVYTYKSLKTATEQCWIRVLNNLVENTSLKEFKRRCYRATNCAKNLDIEKRMAFLNTFHSIFQTVINNEIHKKKTESHLLESVLKELLETFKDLPIQTWENSIYLLILRYLIFPECSRLSNQLDKILALFSRLKNLGPRRLKDVDAQTFIDDSWFDTYILERVDDWTRLDAEQYQRLCDVHCNIELSLQIWSRLLYISFSRHHGHSYDQSLNNFEEWLKTVRRNRYDKKDALTQIFVNTIFELILMRNLNSLMLVSNIESIVEYIFTAHQQTSIYFQPAMVDQFQNIVQDSINTVFSLEGSPKLYQRLMQPSIVTCLLSHVNLKRVVEIADPNRYKFPIVSEQVNKIVSLPIPDDIKFTDNFSEHQNFESFKSQVYKWLEWFDRFTDIFYYLLEYLKIWKLERADQYLTGLNEIRKNPKISVIQIKKIIEEVLKALKSIRDLSRLCDLVNCTQSFEIISTEDLTDTTAGRKSITDFKQSNAIKSFEVGVKTQDEKLMYISDRRSVHWFLATADPDCRIAVEYRKLGFLHEQNYKLFEHTSKCEFGVSLQGEYKTQRQGHLAIIADNMNDRHPCTIWFRIKESPLAVCHLFNGIVQICQRKYFSQPNQTIKDTDLSAFMDRVFTFVDNFLSGEIKLSDMDGLRTVFRDKNIHVLHEVEKLSMNQTFAEQHSMKVATLTTADKSKNVPIDQLCQWLQIYQYYSHIHVIVDCVQKFNLLATERKNQSIDYLQQLAISKNCSLKEISMMYGDLYESFRKLSNPHLELMKAILACSNVVQLMSSSNLYGSEGLRRFQELRDNLTTQFQHQERNSTVLNSWLIAYNLCEPFSRSWENLEQFIDNLSQLKDMDENSMEHLRIVSENMQMIETWLTTTETTMLDNALITMEHLYRTGAMHVSLQRLIDEPSKYDITYYIARKISSEEDSNLPDKDSTEKSRMRLAYQLSTSDVEDHKRQLTFCNVDLRDRTNYRAILLEEQLKLLTVVDKIFRLLLKLEMAGHPYYQVKEERFEISDTFGHIDRMLDSTGDKVEIELQQLREAIEERTKDFESIHLLLDKTYERWMKDLTRYRHENKLFQVLSNRQIMIMLILLTDSSTRDRFQSHLVQQNDVHNHQTNEPSDKLNWIIRSLMHYLQFFRMNDNDLSEDIISRAYNRNKTEAGSSIDTSLKNLNEFLRETLQNKSELFVKTRLIDQSEQYLVIHSAKKQCITSDQEKYCILLNIFRDRLPADHQILWCCEATEEDICLFFTRVRTFCALTFAVMDMDTIHHRLQTMILREQSVLAKQKEPHAPIFYFSKETLSCCPYLQPFHPGPKYCDQHETFAHFMKLVQGHKGYFPQIDIICGITGIGKTHRIKTKYDRNELSAISVNDQMNISSFLCSLFKVNGNHQRYLHFNISIHAPFEKLNRTFFSLFVCGSIRDPSSGLTFSSAVLQKLAYVIEVPYASICKLSIKEHFQQILPSLSSIVSSRNIAEVTDKNYELFITEEEELVGRFLKAYENGSIDRLLVITEDDVEYPVHFDPLQDPDEVRHHIYRAINTYFPTMTRNKIFELSFTKFLYRRIRFFTGHYYCYNTSIERLGSLTLSHMIEEAKSLTHIDFSSEQYARCYLVYDPEFSLHILHNNWSHVPPGLRSLFGNTDPSLKREYTSKNHYFIECLAWLLDIKCDLFHTIMKDQNFILTENFVYKLFHIHERKLTQLPLIIEGETGIGKTFLLNFYAALLNANICHSQQTSDVTPRILERVSLWLSKIVIEGILKREQGSLETFLQRIRPKLDKQADHEERNEMDIEQPLIKFEDEEDIGISDVYTILATALSNVDYDNNMLQCIWKTLLTTIENHTIVVEEIMNALRQFINNCLKEFPLIEPTGRLIQLLESTKTPQVELLIQIFDEFLIHTTMKRVFNRLLLHPGVTEKYIADFLSPIRQLAQRLPQIELVVFFDEVNTSSCLGLFKEIFIDGSLHGERLPKNIFFTAAINPASNSSNGSSEIYRQDYLVHELPDALKILTVRYGILNRNTLEDYIRQKIATFTISSTSDSQTCSYLDQYLQDILIESILKAQEFCERRLGHNSVSQREIQRCFTLIDFFWKLQHMNNSEKPDLLRCIALSLASIYYFRLPTVEDNKQRNDQTTPTREELNIFLSQTIPEFDHLIHNELDQFVNTSHFVIPPGVAINQAIREHIFCIVICIATRIPLCIIGAPGQSKTLSFQIVLQNLQGSQLSNTDFCKRLPEIDPFFCLGSKYTRSEDIAYVFDRAIKREDQYRINRINRRCVVFLDEASLPDEKKMVLKVLHPYLDECKAAFVAVANKPFDAANANRMLCVYRSLPSQEDQLVLAYGCLGLQFDQVALQARNNLNSIVSSLCIGYRRLLSDPNIPKIFHDRDFIYMLRELRFEFSDTHTNIGDAVTAQTIRPPRLLEALENNFNGISTSEFKNLVKIFFESIQQRLSNYRPPEQYRDVPTILYEAMRLDSKQRRLYGRYKLLIDDSEDESAIQLLFQTKILDSDSHQIMIFRMSDFSEDANNDLRHVEILSNIKLCMETGKTIVMVNTNRIHGSLYDVFNQNFSIMATEDTRKIFSKVAIGSKTMDVIVHENFQCLVHIKRSELNQLPAPFLSRFQKFNLNINDFYRIQLAKLSKGEQNILEHVERRVTSFIDHIGKQYFYGLNNNTLSSYLISLIVKDSNGNVRLASISTQYTQLTVDLKSVIEENPLDLKQCFSRLIIVKLVQLLSPESLIVSLPTFDDKVQRWLSTIYFRLQDHFSLERFLQRLISSVEDRDDQAISSPQISHDMKRPTKIMIFTRTSPYILGLNQYSTPEITTETAGVHSQNYLINEKVQILNLGIIENARILDERLDRYRNDPKKTVLLIIIDTRIVEQRKHLPYIRQLIDSTDQKNQDHVSQFCKYYIMLVHSSAQDLYHRSYFPAIFLHRWDFHFFDTCATGNAFHLQKMLQIVTSYSDRTEKSYDDDLLCDLSALFEDCLWDICSRIQIILPELSANMFTTREAFEFYRPQTGTFQRVQYLQGILRRTPELQKLIVDYYHKHLFKKESTSKKAFDYVYHIAKDIISGKRFDGLVESIQNQTRSSINSFINCIMKIILNDYGLETLPKLSSRHAVYGKLLNLIDFESFFDQKNDEIFSRSPSNQGLFLCLNHYSIMPETPLFHLLHQRIQSYVETLKQNRLVNDDGKGYIDGKDSLEHYRRALIQTISRDPLLTDIINHEIIDSYFYDLVQVCCSITENSVHHDNPIERKQIIQFIIHWLSLMDDDDRADCNECSNQTLWLFAHMYSIYDREQADLLFMYAACRNVFDTDENSFIIEQINSNNDMTRSDLRGKTFRHIFRCLWRKLCECCAIDDNVQTWINSYTFISKYYPSEKVLDSISLSDIKGQVQLMHLAYSVFSHSKSSEDRKVIAVLLEQMHWTVTIDGLSLLTSIMDNVHQYLPQENIKTSSFRMDLYGWMIHLLKSSTELSEKQILTVLKYLNESADYICLAEKQYIFGQVIPLLRRCKDNSRIHWDFWDHMSLLPTLLECLTNLDHIDRYRIPDHPTLRNTDEISDKNIYLLDLFFFYLRHYMTKETITTESINKGMVLKAPRSSKDALRQITDNIFQQIQNYFLITMITSWLCENNNDDESRNKVQRMFSKLRQEFLNVDSTTTALNSSIQLFVANIVQYQSWNFLLDSLKQGNLQEMDPQWAKSLYRLLDFDALETEKQYLQLSQQIQFTLLADNLNESIFPSLHQPYQKLRCTLKDCSENGTQPNQWKPLIDWLATRLVSDTDSNSIEELKTLLLLNIYYDYYCTNRLDSIQTLLASLETILPLRQEEKRVFRALIDPVKYLVGYSENQGQNSLNRLFKLDCQDHFDLSQRHLLVNLMAMIILGGDKSFLWTFAFEPSKLTSTFGFGSTTLHRIESDGVHYDCGCIISQNGDLIRYNNRLETSDLNIPAIYVVYFSTYGALAWHLLLYRRSVDNLHGPILSPMAINDTTSAHRIEAHSVRTKTCHFVYARLFSTFHFLSIRSNPSDACLLLTRCFEQMAFLTRNHADWIQPIYTSFKKQIAAEKQYQIQVFYPVFNELPKYKAAINRMHLRSKIQFDLQSYINYQPIVLKIEHFQTELHRPNSNARPSSVFLRRFLDSLDNMFIIKLIYDLGQFYLLLHRTYGNLIEKEEFLSISLQELHERGEKYLQHSDYQQHDQNRQIIDKAISAVRRYHQFTMGLIRPGACNETQRFQPIEFGTPVHYLVTNDNPDEGNIIMRILSILVDNHNDLLEMLQANINSTEEQAHSVIGALVNRLASQEVSILHILNTTTGIIDVDENDRSWIEQLCLASLIEPKEQKFIYIDSPLAFNFDYIQSQLISQYLLLCRVNYRHIIQKYQCFQRPKPRDTTLLRIHDLHLDEKYTISFTDEELEKDWSHLRTMSMDKLYSGHTFLRQLAMTIQNQAHLEATTTSLFDFIASNDSTTNYGQRLEQCEIKDFTLCHLDHVITLYARSVTGYEHIFHDISPLLQVQLDASSNDSLKLSLHENVIRPNIDSDIDKLQEMIQIITLLLDDLKSIEMTLLPRSKEPLVETCGYLSIENHILSFIPSTVRCENYMTVLAQLLQIRSDLEKQKLILKEKGRKLWQEDPPIHPTQVRKLTYRYLDSDQSTGSDEEEFPDRKDASSSASTAQLKQQIDLALNRSDSIDSEVIDTDTKYPSLFELRMQFVPCRSSVFFEQMQKYREEVAVETGMANKASKFTIIHPDKKRTSLLCRGDKFHDNLRKIFAEKKYNANTFAVLGTDSVSIDVNHSGPTLLPPSSAEYSIVEKNQLIHVQFNFQTQTFDYFTTPNNCFGNVVKHFIDTQQLKPVKSDLWLCFYDCIGRCIGDREIVDLIGAENKSLVTIDVTEAKPDEMNLCEVQLIDVSQEHIVLFHHACTWKHVADWLQRLVSKSNGSPNAYAFFSEEEQRFFDLQQSLVSSSLQPNTTMTIQVIDQNMILKLVLSFDTIDHSVYVLKSRTITSILKNAEIREKMHLTEDSMEDYMVTLQETTTSRILSKNVLRQPIINHFSEGTDTIHLRLSLSKSIVIRYKQEDKSVAVTDMNMTVADLVNSITQEKETTKYLASKHTKKVRNMNELISALNETSFLLVDEQEICEVRIIQLDETENVQQFCTFATLADLYHEYHLDDSNQHLLFADDFVPSPLTPLSVLQPPVQFKVVENNLPVTVVILFDEEGNSLQFNVTREMNLERICSIANQLLNIDGNSSRLTLIDETEVDNEITLMDIDEEMTEIKFRLHFPEGLSCSILCDGQTIVSRCQEDTLLKSLVKETLEKLHISPDQIDNYELYNLSDDPMEIDLDLTIDEVKSLFDDSSKLLSFELKCKVIAEEQPSDDPIDH